MSSTILYKFRSGTTFEALPLPGSAARLFDVKKAIVMAKKLDQGSIEFDLSVRDATTGTEYTDEAMLLPRGTRLVVQRLPAAKGHGILAKIARSQYGMAPSASASTTATVAPNNYYTIESRGHDDQDEFVSSSTAGTPMNNSSVDGDKELAALRAATETANEAARGIRPAPMGGYRAAGGPPPTGGRGGGASHYHQAPRQRPNADPELREQEKQLMPKKRATGIPRTFLSLSAPPTTDGNKEGESNVPLLQPNTIGFEELKHRGGGQSESAGGSKRDLDYALKLTATTIPEYLQCAICNGVVRDAMILPWDPEGRTTCEICIRDALAQNGFRCPLTGQDGVSPDDLLPNHALRKAAEQFIKKVMEQMEDIEKQQVEDDTRVVTTDGGADSNKASSLLEGDGADKGVILSKRASIAEKRKKQEEEDPFGGDDDFGGDVFAVETEKPPVEEKEQEQVMETEEDQAVEKPQGEEPKEEKTPVSSEGAVPTNGTGHAQTKDTEKMETEAAEQEPSAERNAVPSVDTTTEALPQAIEKSPAESSARREAPRRRGPPAGYTMGPAGGAYGGPRESPPGQGYSPREERGRGGRYGGRSRGWNDRNNGTWGHRDTDQSRREDDGGRGIKRSWSESESASQENPSYQSRRDDYGGRTVQREFRGRGRGGYRGGGGYYRGGRGGWDDRGGGYHRGRGGYRGGRGRY